MIKELGNKSGRNLWEMPCLAATVNIQPLTYNPIKIPYFIVVCWWLYVDSCAARLQQKIA